MKLNMKIITIFLVFSTMVFSGCQGIQGVENVVEQSKENNAFDMNNTGQNRQIPQEESVIPPPGEEISIPTN